MYQVQPCKYAITLINNPSVHFNSKWQAELCEAQSYLCKKGVFQMVRKYKSEGFQYGASFTLDVFNQICKTFLNNIINVLKIIAKYYQTVHDCHNFSFNLFS